MVTAPYQFTNATWGGGGGRGKQKLHHCAILNRLVDILGEEPVGITSVICGYPRLLMGTIISQFLEDFRGN